METLFDISKLLAKWVYIWNTSRKQVSRAHFAQYVATTRCMHCSNQAALFSSSLIAPNTWIDVRNIYQRTLFSIAGCSMLCYQTLSHARTNRERTHMRSSSEQWSSFWQCDNARMGKVARRLCVGWLCVWVICGWLGWTVVNCEQWTVDCTVCSVCVCVYECGCVFGRTSVYDKCWL